MGFLVRGCWGHGESERTDEWKNQERERGFVVCVVNSQTWGGALVRPVLSDFVKSRPHNGQCTHILIPLGQILSEPSPLTHTKSNPSIPPRVAFIGGTHARPYQPTSAHVNPPSPNLSYHYQCAPTTYTTLSHSSRLLVFPSSNSLSSFHPLFRPSPCPFFILPHIPHYNTPAASRRVLTL